MILSILPRPTPDTAELANEILGKSIFVSWPHLVEARVIAVSSQDTSFKLSSGRGEEIVKEEMKGPLMAQWNLSKKVICEK